MLLLLQLGRTADMMPRYNELLAFAADVTRNEYSDAINKVLNAVSDGASLAHLEQVYQVSLRQLKSMGNQERMWFNTNLRLCKTYMSMAATNGASTSTTGGTGDSSSGLDRASAVLDELHASCRLAGSGVDDKSKGAQLLEIYALEFQLHSERRDNAKLKVLFARTKDLSAEVNDPRSMSVIRECWGKMYANDGQWNEAFSEFFSAFKQYQEIGHARAKQCLKYVVIAGLLSQSQVNPFDAQEAKVYERTPEIQAMVGIRTAYERGDTREVETILRHNHATILDDPFIRQHLDEILTQIRSKTLRDLIRPYRTVRLAHLAAKLSIDEAAVQALLVPLILDEKVAGRIDQVNGVLDLTAARTGASHANAKYAAITQWANAIESTQRILTHRLAL